MGTQAPSGQGLTRGLPAPNSPHTGSGITFDVYEFAKNVSALYTDGDNETDFTFNSANYPTGYEGYRMHTMVSGLGRTFDALQGFNGDFDAGWAELGGNWTETTDQGVVTSIYNTSGGSPDQCLALEMKGGNVRWGKYNEIDDWFYYMPSLEPSLATCSFSIKYGSDLTGKLEFSVQLYSPIVSPSTLLNEWVLDISTPWAPTHGYDVWHNESFTTDTYGISGPILLRIKVLKVHDNGAVKGHVYFDNFKYTLLTDCTPTEVQLALNGTALQDGLLNDGSVDIYADPANMTEAPMTNTWETDQLFQFTTNDTSIHYDYNYTMYVKSLDADAATSTFTAPVDEDPTWEINYTIPTTGSPPTTPIEYTGYCYGIFLDTAWTLTSVRNHTGHAISTYTYNTTSYFVKLDEDVPSADETFSIYASSSNYILEMIPQKAASSSGPWTNLTSGDYYIKGDWMRVLVLLNDIGAETKYANVSVFYPNRDLWMSNNTPVYDTYSNSFVAGGWQIPQLVNASDAGRTAGSDWLITATFNTNKQSGMREKSMTAAIETYGTKIAPNDGLRVIWGDTITVNATWTNQDNSVNITDASLARIRFIDRYSQIQYVVMSPNGYGSYSTDLATDLMTPDRTAQFQVEMFGYGYVNVSYDEGTHLSYTINLVNDLDLIMVKPTQKVGENYEAETTSVAGYVSQVRFYDTYQEDYVQNASIWINTEVVYNYYEDTGSGFGGVISTGSFIPDAADPTLYERNDTSYTGVARVKYECNMTITNPSTWDYEQQNFTIIIWIVQFQTNLDAIRTTVTYPPTGTGDGWTQYDAASDGYEVNVYWREKLNITVYYTNESTGQGIGDASANLTIDTSMSSMSNVGGGYYYYSLNTSTVGIGSTDLYVNATRAEHATQTIKIRLIVVARATTLTKDQPGSTKTLPYDEDFAIVFTYQDSVPTVPDPLENATGEVGCTVTGYITGYYTIQGHGDGTYTVTFFGNLTETTYYVTIAFTRTNHTGQSQYFEITIREVYTTSYGSADPASVAWGDNVSITLNYNDTDHSYAGIDGATISFTWQDDIAGVDYWITDNNDGTYTILLSTLKVASGTQNFLITFESSKTHYENATAMVSFQVRDILSALYIVSIEPGTSVPWGDTMTIVLTYNDTEHSYIPIIGAVISCDWDTFYWSFAYNATDQTYILTINTASQNEGSYSLHIYANCDHYTTGMTIQSFVIREIQTGFTVDPVYVGAHPWGDNITFTLVYLDLDHGGNITLAEIETDWDPGYFTFYWYLNGSYAMELDTTCKGLGIYSVEFVLYRNHYANATVTVQIVIIPRPLFVAVLSTSPVTVDYGGDVVVTVQITDHHGYRINDSTTVFRWGGHADVAMSFIGNGVWNVTFTANETIGTYIVIVETSKTYHQTAIGSVTLNILPIGTTLTILNGTITILVGDTFQIMANFTDEHGTPLTSDVTMFFTWADKPTEYFTHLGDILGSAYNGMYNATLNSTGLSYGVTYIVTVIGLCPNHVDGFDVISVNVIAMPVSLEIDFPHLDVPWGENFTIEVYFNNTYSNSPVTGALIIWHWDGEMGYFIEGVPPSPGSIPPAAGDYYITLQTDQMTVGEGYSLVVEVDHPGMQYTKVAIDVSVIATPTLLDEEYAQSYYGPTGYIDLEPIYEAPIGDELHVYYNFSYENGDPVTTGAATYYCTFDTGNLEYNATELFWCAKIDLTGVPVGLYTLNVLFVVPNHETGSMDIDFRVIEVPTQVRLDTSLEIATTNNTIEVFTGTPFDFKVIYWDTHHDIPISEALVRFESTNLWAQTDMTDSGNGYYTASGLSVAIDGSYRIDISAQGETKHAQGQMTITLVVKTHPLVALGFQSGLLIALIGLMIIIGWLIYTRLFAIPWFVRKCRSMARTIGRGKHPHLSDRDRQRLPQRPVQMIDIVDDSYDTIGVKVTAAMIPAALALEEREAEDDVIWRELEALEGLGPEQKRELFEEMRRIPAKDRVWFLEDLKRQLADGTRFAHTTADAAREAPPETVAPSGVDPAIAARVEALKTLGPEEKQAILAQLSTLSKAEQEAVIMTLEEGES